MSVTLFIVSRNNKNKFALPHTYSSPHIHALSLCPGTHTVNKLVVLLLLIISAFLYLVIAYYKFPFESKPTFIRHCYLSYLN